MFVVIWEIFQKLQWHVEIVQNMANDFRNNFRRISVATMLWMSC